MGRGGQHHAGRLHINDVVYLLIIYGYRGSSTTVPPINLVDLTCIRTEIPWSEWFESMRNDDVECIYILLEFGTVADVGVRIHGTVGCLRCDLEHLLCVTQ